MMKPFDNKLFPSSGTGDTLPGAAYDLMDRQGQSPRMIAAPATPRAMPLRSTTQSPTFQVANRYYQATGGRVGSPNGWNMLGHLQSQPQAPQRAVGTSPPVAMPDLQGDIAANTVRNPLAASMASRYTGLPMSGQTVRPPMRPMEPRPTPAGNDPMYLGMQHPMNSADQFERSMEQGRIDNRANTPNALRNPSVPFNPGQRGYGDAQMAYSNKIEGTGRLMDGFEAQQNVRDTGYMPNMIGGAGYGRVAGTDTPEDMQLRKDRALTAAMAQREQGQGLQFNDPVNTGGLYTAPRVNSDPGLWYNQPRNYANPLETAQGIQAATAGRSMAMGGQVMATPEGGLRGNPLSDVNAARSEIGMNPLATRATPSAQYQQNLDDRNQMRVLKAMSAMGDRRERLGMSQVTPSDNPLWSQGMQEQAANMPLQLQQLRNQGGLDIANTSGAWNLMGSQQLGENASSLANLNNAAVMERQKLAAETGTQSDAARYAHERDMNAERMKNALQIANSGSENQDRRARIDARNQVVQALIGQGALSPDEAFNAIDMAFTAPQGNPLQLPQAIPNQLPQGQGALQSYGQSPQGNQPAAANPLAPLGARSRPYINGTMSQQDYDKFKMLYAENPDAALAFANSFNTNNDPAHTDAVRKFFRDNSGWQSLFTGGYTDPTMEGGLGYYGPIGYIREAQQYAPKRPMPMGH